MKINRKNAMRIWEEMYGNHKYANDFHGNYMCRDGYGDPDYYIWSGNRKIYCGWNIHHILPIALGGTNSKENLICTNIVTNSIAEDKITFWIDDSLYQVKRIRGTSEHEIVELTD